MGVQKQTIQNQQIKIPSEIRKEILAICNRPEYASMAPCEIVSALADEGIYIASESTFYRVLREEKMLNHRGHSEAPKQNRPSTYHATAPNQVYMWDITYLNGSHKPVRECFTICTFFMIIANICFVTYITYRLEAFF